jgi:hypothetical protein
LACVISGSRRHGGTVVQNLFTRWEYAFFRCSSP